MIKKVFALYDSKAEVYNTPVLFNTKGEALRAFTQLANDMETQVGKYPADFTLFEIGEYDDSTGHYTMLPSKIPLGMALEHQRLTNSIPNGQMTLAPQN